MKTLMNKTSLGPKSLQLKKCVHNEKKINPPKDFFSFQRNYQVIRAIRFVIRRGQDCDSRRAEKTGRGRRTFLTPGFNKDACGKQHNLVVRNEERYRKQVQHMHCMHEFRKELEVSLTIYGKNQTTDLDRTRARDTNLISG